MSALPREAVTPVVQEWLSEHIHRPPGRWLARRLVTTNVSPMQVTLLAGLAGIIAGALFIAGVHRPAFRLVGGIALMISGVLDCADGELARARSQSSLVGMMLDGFTDNIVGVAVFFGMAVNIVTYTGRSWTWTIGIAAGLSAAAHVWLYDAKKKQFLHCLGLAEPEEILPVSSLRVRRDRAWREGNRIEAFLYAIYIFFRRSQGLESVSASRSDPMRFWRANRGTMKAWTCMGSTMHFLALSVAAIASVFWPQAFLACALFYVVVLNIAFAILLRLKWT